MTKVVARNAPVVDPTVEADGVALIGISSPCSLQAAQ